LAEFDQQAATDILTELDAPLENLRCIVENVAPEEPLLRRSSIKVLAQTDYLPLPNKAIAGVSQIETPNVNLPGWMITIEHARLLHSPTGD